MLQFVCERPPVGTPAVRHEADPVRRRNKYEGRIMAQGRKWVSADGGTLTFTAVVRNARDEEIEFLFVFDRIP
jgi:hypothetical protein